MGFDEAHVARGYYRDGVDHHDVNMPKEGNAINGMLDALIENATYEHDSSDITLLWPFTDIGIHPKGKSLK